MGGLLPDEAVTLYLSPENVIRLQTGEDDNQGGVFEAEVWVDHSIFVEFQTTKSSTSAGREPEGVWCATSCHQQWPFLRISLLQCTRSASQQWQRTKQQSSARMMVEAQLCPRTQM